MTMKILENIEQWLNLRTPRERLYVVACALIAITFLWFTMWESTYQNIRKTQLSNSEAIKNKILSFQDQDRLMKRALNDSRLINKRETLKQQIREADVQINAVSSQLVSPSVMSKALKKILSETSGLTLLRLNNSEGSVVTSIVPQKDQSNNKITLYQHNFTLELEGDYSSTVEYLKKLEKSPYRFFTDSIDYKVGQYPKAVVILKLHTVSKGRDLINDE